MLLTKLLAALVLATTITLAPSHSNAHCFLPDASIQLDHGQSFVDAISTASEPASSLAEDLSTLFDAMFLLALLPQESMLPRPRVRPVQLAIDGHAIGDAPVLTRRLERSRGVRLLCITGHVLGPLHVSRLATSRTPSPA